MAKETFEQSFKKARIAAMSFAEAKAIATSINDEVDAAGAVLKRYPTGPMGLPLEEIRTGAEYRAAKATFDRAFAKLRDFNEIYVKQFAKELRAERDARRAGKG